ncbi:EAL domain-containing protein [Natronosporangium hydrolyticum]|uniref:EAL domain-containing protein n=1 Tax=Natronosporangium hydrolyticum TaxID=2811111 RepID=A0A895Y9L2_9ACTN|nr:EAL domain-containing protein [Natronosporangium hydrolyticum]QSB14021.1 EAL domain-containing protein [Natronosporangium hydrolyticum]
MTDNWSVHLLTEYFSAVSASEDEPAAIETAAARAAEALDAEVGAVVMDDEVRGCWGFGTQSAPADLVTAAHGSPTLSVSSLGVLFTATGHLGRTTPGALLVARTDRQFQADERLMLHGMGQVLGLALRGLRTLGTERALREQREREAEERLRLLEAVGTRQRLLETLLSIQRAISKRRPLQEVLDAVTEGASGLLENAEVALVLRPSGTDQLTVASTYAPGIPGTGGGDEEVEAAGATARVRASAAQAMRAGDVVTQAVVGGQGSSGMMLATPVHVGGAVGGSLVALTTGYGDIADQRELLTAFAQQVNLALTDAQTIRAIREAYHDSITGLPNRALFLEKLKQGLANARRNEEVLVLYIDLDRFKEVNDSFGHSTGDEMLAEVAERIRSCVGSEDTAARLGGDEFAVMLEHSDPAAGVQLANEIIGAVRQPFWIAGRNVFIDASAGVASSESGRTDPVELLSNADLAMYHVKRRDPGHTAVFEPEMRAAILRRLELHTDLKYALALSELTLQFQPLISLDSAELVAVEALLRWPHPRHGPVPTAELVRMAEETGLIVEIGRWVMRASAKQVAAWRTALPGLSLNVNVSAREIADSEFPATVADVLTETGLTGGALTLELTETGLMTDPDGMAHCLSQLKALGVQLAVDDFGTGYSSLAYLCRLPVDQLKIDRSFVAGLTGSSPSRAVVRAIVELAHTLGIQAVAEGVEDGAQLDALRVMGCELGQGYHFARPLDPDDVPALLSRELARTK